MSPRVAEYMHMHDIPPPVSQRLVTSLQARKQEQIEVFIAVSKAGVAYAELLPRHCVAEKKKHVACAHTALNPADDISA